MVNKNIIYNYVGTAWNLISIYLFLPFYLKLLNIESYGLILFASTINSVIFLLDIGFSAYVRRELSWGIKDNTFYEKSKSLLKSIELFYFIILAVITIFIVLTSKYLTNNWFNFTQLSFNEVRFAIIIICISSVLQMLLNLYIGSLQALELQLLSNKFQFFFSLFKNGLVILVIYKFPTALAFLIWQMFVILLFIVLLRYNIFKNHIVVSGIKMKVKKNLSIIKKALGLSSLFFIISIFSTINFQIDKLIISKLMSISDLAYYNTAFTLGQVLITIVTPISVALGPRLIQNFYSKNLTQMRSLLDTYFIFGIILVTSVASILFIYRENLVYYWTRDKNFTWNINILLPYMIIAGLFMSAQVLPFNIAIATKKLKPIIATCIINLALTIPFYYWATIKFGLKGPAIVWMVSNIFMMIFNNYFYLKKVLEISILKWYSKCFIMPVVVTTSFTITISYLKPDISSIKNNIFLIFLNWTVAFFFSTYVFFFTKLNIVAKKYVIIIRNTYGK